VTITPNPRFLICPAPFKAGVPRSRRPLRWNLARRAKPFPPLSRHSGQRHEGAVRQLQLRRTAPAPRPTLPHPLIADLECLAATVASAADLQVVAVHLHTHRIPMTVQVMVRRSDGGDISLEACAAFSGPLGDALEESALLDSAYVLEVSSPGIGEELTNDRDFTSFRGFPVAVSVMDGQGAEQIREGLLLGRDELEVRLNVRGRTLRFPRAAVTHVRLVSPRDGP